ncbi:hypothetical protein ACFL2R_00755, partial [Patescibacteria group bacterium]
MRQVFYIDINEEVTSVIDRLRKASSKSLAFVVPARALILNSIVSLKLVKNKADGLGIDVVIVTNDKIGRDLANRGGFVVRASLDELNDIVSGKQEKEESSESRPVAKIDIGSESDEGPKLDISSTTDRPVASKGMNGIHSKSQRGSINGVRRRASFDMGPAKKPESDTVKEREKNVSQLSQRVDISGAVSDSGFQVDLHRKKQEASGKKRISSKKLRFVFVVFLIICIVLIAGIFSYLFLPKADIYVYPQSNIKEIDLSVIADTKTESLDMERKIIRAKLISTSDSISGEYESSGQDYATGQKAKGKVVIYNNYSEDDQILVATTRLEDEEGRIYRLVKGVTVPGIVEEDGEIVLGEVEAEIVADKSGSEYNIEPSRFTIPGFKSGPKYDKFYAKSGDKITGGGSWGDKVGIITDKDILSARSDIEKKLSKEIESKLTGVAGDGYIVDKDSLKREIVSYEVFPDNGAVAESFEYGLTMNAEGLAYNEEDLKTIINNIIGSEEGVELIEIDIEYGQISSDFEEGYLEISAHATVKFQYELDSSEILENLLGIKDDQLKMVIDQYPEIKRIDIMHWPKIFSDGIPRNRNRV